MDYFPAVGPDPCTHPGLGANANAGPAPRHGGVAPASNQGMPWIRVAPGAPYFITGQGENWTPIGQNDALCWPDLLGAYKRKDLASVRRYFAMLSAHGITCMRLMLEYCQGEHRYLERTVGVFHPAMVALWDDLFALCEAYGIRLLLTPFDTFWMRRRWAKHPYNKRNGGPCSGLSKWLLCPATLQATQKRLAFATGRWGGSGVIFGWDLYNEIDPRLAAGEVTAISEWVSQVSTFLRATEIQLHGRAHLQTVSVYGPLLKAYPQLNEVVFRHPLLDFATVHFYDAPIRKPTDPVRAGVRAGELVRQGLKQITDGRPFLDSEHGPDCLFRQLKGRIPLDFDEAYFRCVQWAHLAAGGAGGGMRWPYRHPHSLTAGMRTAQRMLAELARQVDWQHFDRRNVSEQLKVSPGTVKAIACGNTRQVLLWIACNASATPEQESTSSAASVLVSVTFPFLPTGTYWLRVWNTRSGRLEYEENQTLGGQAGLSCQLPLRRSDVVMLVKRMG